MDIPTLVRGEVIPYNGKKKAGCSHPSIKVTTDILTSMYNILLCNATLCERINVGARVSDKRVTVNDTE